MNKSKLPKKFVERCRRVTAKRARTVIDHILQHGFITTQELKDKYGYNHPPRAARDVKENGIPIEMFRVVGSDGRKIGAYRFGDPDKLRFDRFSGRTVLTKELKKTLVAKYGAKCAIYLADYPARDLQIDHRIPFEVAGDSPEATPSPDDFMLLSASANRAKSWSCEHCANWIERKNATICRSCYWAYPENYSHVAMRPVRRLDLIWEGDEVSEYDRLKKKTEQLQQSMPAFIKAIIARTLD